MTASPLAGPGRRPVTFPDLLGRAAPEPPAPHGPRPHPAARDGLRRPAAPPGGPGPLCGRGKRLRSLHSLPDRAAGRGRPRPGGAEVPAGAAPVRGTHLPEPGTPRLPRLTACLTAAAEGVIAVTRGEGGGHLRRGKAPAPRRP